MLGVVVTVGLADGSLAAFGGLAWLAFSEGLVESDLDGPGFAAFGVDGAVGFLFSGLELRSRSFSLSAVSSWLPLSSRLVFSSCLVFCPAF
jgi:hypothetical protein